MEIRSAYNDFNLPTASELNPARLSFFMSKEIFQYKNALAHQKFDFGESPIIRLSRETNSADQYVSNYEGIIDPFLIDQSKIFESKATRRLLDKTQVVFSPSSPHIRVRASHTSEVNSTAKNISDILGLNNNLVEAISLGHDIGHAPAGHLFERIAKEDFGVEFKHEIFSAIITVFIERHGMGLNLTRQTVHGILNHSQGSSDDFSNHLTNESRLVMYSDKIAYIFADINDLQRVGVFSSSDLTKIDSIFPIDTTFGNNQRTRVSACIDALIKESSQKGYVSFEDSQVAQNFKNLKKYMYGYYNKLDSDSLKETVKSVIDRVSDIQNYDPILLTAMMTDTEMETLNQKIIRAKRINIDDLVDFGVGEIIRDGDFEGQTYDDLVIKLKQKFAEQKF